jgi:chromosome segregation ATPase
MSRLSLQVGYDKKIKELGDLIQAEAQKLQKVLEAKDSALLETRKLKEQKTSLEIVLVSLENKIKEKENNLNQLIEREGIFLSSIKKEINQEKDKLKETKSLLEEKNLDLDSLTKLSFELNKFIEKEGDIRIQYLDQKQKLDKAQDEYKEISKEAKTEKEFLEIKNKELDSYKEYVINLYGKLASYVKTANDSIKFVNTYFEENGVPIEFKLPPGEIIQVDFDNFNIKKTDT